MLVGTLHQRRILRKIEASGVAYKTNASRVGVSGEAPALVNRQGVILDRTANGKANRLEPGGSLRG
jgi:hypothetical protein